MEIKGVELPIFLIKEVFLQDNKITVKLLRDKTLDYTFSDNRSAKKIYNNIVEKMKRKENLNSKLQ